VKESDTQLQEIKVQSSFLDPFIKLPMVRKQPLNVLKLSYKPSKLTVKRNKMSSIYFLQYKIYMLLKIATINLHASMIYYNRIFFYR